MVAFQISDHAVTFLVISFLKRADVLYPFSKKNSFPCAIKYTVSKTLRNALISFAVIFRLNFFKLFKLAVKEGNAFKSGSIANFAHLLVAFN